MIDASLLVTLFALGLFGGALSGLIGIGGGIVMFPLLLYVPGVLGIGLLSVKTAASITAVQSFFGAASGAWGHGHHGRIHRRLAFDFGGPMAVTALMGSLASDHAPESLIIGVFATMAVLAAGLTFLPKPQSDAAPEPYKRRNAQLVGAAIGLAAGLVGQGGGFLFVPVMLFLLKIPLRTAIGTALVVGVATSGAVLLGRIGTAQIPYPLAAATVTGTILGARIGAALSQRAPQRALKSLLSLVVGATALKMLYSVIAAH